MGEYGKMEDIKVWEHGRMGGWEDGGYLSLGGMGVEHVLPSGWSVRPGDSAPQGLLAGT